MKFIHVIAPLFILFCFSCIENHESSLLLDDAEALFETNTDSAQLLLDEAELIISNERDFARWCLLSGKIEDERRKKQYPKALLSIDQWLRAKEYYDKHVNMEDRAYIRLYLGRSLFDDRKYDDAAIVYKEGLDLAQKTNAYSISGYLCSFLGDLYFNKMMGKEATEKYNEAVDFHQKGGNIRSWALALKDLSVSYAYNELYDDALLVLMMADSIISNIDDKFAKSIILNSFGIIYEEMQDYDSAEKFYLKSLEIHFLDQSPVYLNLSLISLKKENTLMARQFLNKAIPDLTNDVVFYQIYQIEKSEKNIDSALFYLEKYQECLDSLYKEQNKINVHEIEKKYDKSRIINEKNRIQLYLQRLIILGLVFAIILIIAFFIYNKYKNNQLRLKENAIKEMDNEYLFLSAQLKEKECLLDEKERLSEDFLNQKMELDLLRNSLFEGKLELVRQSHVGRKLVVISNGITSKSTTLNEREWNSLELVIKGFFPELYVLIIKVTFRSSDDSFRLCLLSFFGLATKEEAFLLKKSDEAVRQNRTRLRKLFKIDDSQNILSYFQKYS